uniref:Transposase n=1 Tax=Mesocestoides corti TaxID=53468 RepID=A0A5K3FU05_MESCO
MRRFVPELANVAIFYSTANKCECHEASADLFSIELIPSTRPGVTLKSFCLQLANMCRK